MYHHCKIDYWESCALKLLRKATIAQGIKASCTNTTNYGSVFTRDAVMAGVAGILYKDEKVINGLRSTIEMLNKTKGSQGQIASNYKIIDDQIEHISFGTLSPKFDSVTWYLIGVGLLMEEGFNYDIDYVEQSINLLDALEYNASGLIYIPQGGNWADEYPYEGYILYDQALRVWALRLLGRQFNRKTWIEKSDSIQKKIDNTYFNKDLGYYNCSFSPSHVNSTFDFAAHNILGLQDGLIGDGNYTQYLTWLYDSFLSNKTLPGAFYPVINEQDSSWSLLSNFHLFEFKNRPYHYHNGGVWMIWIGWHALVLKKHGNLDALESLANIVFEKLNSYGEFNFEEYLTGDTYVPSGTKELCYTAAGVLFLCHALK